MSAPSSRPSTPSLLPDHQTSHPAHKLLTLAHPSSPETVTKLFTEKILHKPLLLTTTSIDPSDNRAARRHLRLHKKAYALKHARPKPLSAREKRELGLYRLRPGECQYSIYRELNGLWRRYILEVLGFLDRERRVVKGRIGSAVSASSGAGLVASADFHGMEVEVVRCADVGRVGLKGIVVRETRSTLTIVCDEREDVKIGRRKGKWRDSGRGDKVEQSQEQDKVRMIMKRGSVFRVVIDLPLRDEKRVGVDGEGDTPIEEGQIGSEETKVSDKKTKRQLIFELHGDQLEIRPTERAVKKFKWKAMDYL